MKSAFKNIGLYVSLSAILVASSCKPELSDFEPQAGQADFTKYIAIGNSLTAGYADGGLYLEGQEVAYPNLLAEQLSSVGVGEFRSPLFSQDQRNGSGYLKLTGLQDGQPVLEPVTTELAIRGVNPKNDPLYTKFTSDIENFGVPGMRMDLAFAPGLGTQLGNPFFERLLDDDAPQTLTYQQYVSEKEHTFFSFWLGNNDILGYAMNGAVAVEDDPTTTLTQTSTFTALLNNFIDALTVGDTKGVLATIPDVTAIPFFTTVTRSALLAAASASAGQEIENIYITAGSGEPRAATDEDLFVLPFSSSGLLGSTSDQNPAPYGLHPLNPVESKYVLDAQEVKEVQARVKEFNAAIKDVAKAKNLALADAFTYLNKIKSPGIQYNGIGVNASFITGNAFSLDGIHLTPMGNALLANLFIDAINSTYRSKLPKVNAAQYRGVKFP
ncbi:MAG: SGNH/GDSL hydrolase family protein [Sphingobacterium sp.]|uniref:SGNH/GDSL hydrolase family protein n=1 Tax=Sphingobacterium sp. JB170 TaxID=1434842 RepID=UPI00097F4C76|nr:SGNH/GDSL hydrolase family protein [Sphingobacterium sp. JB170]SJN15938.1 hypothetical protein FM107_00255 [Sphingobacterium sp. JB170]